MVFYLASTVAIEDVRGAGDVFEMFVVEDAEAHCRDAPRTSAERIRDGCE